MRSDKKNLIVVPTFHYKVGEVYKKQCTITLWCIGGYTADGRYASCEYSSVHYHRGFPRMDDTTMLVRL